MKQLLLAVVILLFSQNSGIQAKYASTFIVLSIMESSLNLNVFLRPQNVTKFEEITQYGKKSIMTGK